VIVALDDVWEDGAVERYGTLIAAANAPTAAPERAR
jgi:hypothetical protein